MKLYLHLFLMFFFHIGGNGGAAAGPRSTGSFERQRERAATGATFPKFLEKTLSSVPRILFPLQCPCLGTSQEGW